MLRDKTLRNHSRPALMSQICLVCFAPRRLWSGCSEKRISENCEPFLTGDKSTPQTERHAHANNRQRILDRNPCHTTGEHCAHARVESIDQYRIISVIFICFVTERLFSCIDVESNKSTLSVRIKIKKARQISSAIFITMDVSVHLIQALRPFEWQRKQKLDPLKTMEILRHYYSQHSPFEDEFFNKPFGNGSIQY